MSSRLLLDTHAFLWWLEGSSRLAAGARSSIADPHNEIVVSAASIWEIAIKLSIGKLTMRDEDARRLPEVIAECGFAELSISAAHAADVRALPMHHSDPFDRILVAQALAEELRIVTADPAIAAYGVRTLPAA